MANLYTVTGVQVSVSDERGKSLLEEAGDYYSDKAPEVDTTDAKETVRKSNNSK